MTFLSCHPKIGSACQRGNSGVTSCRQTKYFEIFRFSLFRACENCRPFISITNEMVWLGIMSKRLEWAVEKDLQSKNEEFSDLTNYPDLQLSPYPLPLTAKRGRAGAKDQKTKRRRNSNICDRCSFGNRQRRGRESEWERGRENEWRKRQVNCTNDDIEIDDESALAACDLRGSPYPLLHSRPPRQESTRKAGRQRRRRGKGRDQWGAALESQGVGKARRSSNEQTDPPSSITIKAGRLRAPW